MKLNQSFDFKTKEAFESSYRKYYIPLCHFANRYLASENESVDLVQDLFVDIWTNREKININQSVKSYLYAAVRNRSLNKLKSRLGVELTPINSDDFTAPPVNYDFPELEMAIQKAISSLPKKCREIFELSREQNLKYSQIAIQLNISEKTVENQIHIALTRLREATREFLTVFLF